MERPDLSQIDPKVKQYIDYLEQKLRINQATHSSTRRESSEQIETDTINTAPLPVEPPTSIQIISLSIDGTSKRTSRHLFSPQHRGGMGVFDLETRDPDFPAVLASVDETQNLLLFTNMARVFRYPIIKIPQTPIRSKGEQFDRVQFEENERVVAILPEQAQGYIAMASTHGRVRTLRHHVFGEHMKPGTVLYPHRDFGSLAAVCWTNGDADLFMVTKHGIGIRFNEKLVSPQGDWGLKTAPDDDVVGITSVYADSAVFMVGADGKGTARLMTGFAPNKSTGGSGKIAMKNDRVIAATSIESGDNLFIITKSGKIIRFPADEVPPTEGVVQGVNCILLRNDEATAMIKSPHRFP